MRLKELNSWIISIGLHGLLFMAAIFTWKTNKIINPDPSISVDIIAENAQDIGNSAQMADQQNQLSQEESTNTPQSQASEIAPPPPPPSEPIVQQAPKPIETSAPKPLEALKALISKPQPKPAPTIPTPKPAPIQKAPTPTPQPQTPIKKVITAPQKPISKAPIQNNDIDYRFDIPAAQKSSSGVNSGVKNAPKLTSSGQTSKGQGQGAGKRLQSGLENVLRDQVKRCWVEPADLSDKQSLLVELQIELNENGTLMRVPKLIYPSSKSGASASLLVAIDNAIRATKQCAPYVLPPDRYAEWQNFTFRFDPQKLRH